jgi:hypothetical protein
MIVTEWHARFEMTNALQHPHTLLPPTCHVSNFHALKFLNNLRNLDLTRTSEFHKLKAKIKKTVISLR